MLQFQQELYCQLYISNLKENKGTFNEIDALKEVVIDLILKAQKANQISNRNDALVICYGCGIQWCLHQIQDIREEFTTSLKAILII